MPFCQDTGTATVYAKKGSNVWTNGTDEEALSKGIYQTYTEENLRYSQNAALNMYDEVNTGTNLPAQIDLVASHGNEYKFLFIAKGGGSANKSYLFQETKAILNPFSLEKFLTEKPVEQLKSDFDNIKIQFYKKQAEDMKEEIEKLKQKLC